MERCEKISPETYHKTVEQMEDREGRLYLPRVDREGKSLGDQDYMVPSPPERDKPSLTQADLEKYYHENHHMTKVHLKFVLHCHIIWFSSKIYSVLFIILYKKIHDSFLDIIIIIIFLGNYISICSKLYLCNNILFFTRKFK